MAGRRFFAAGFTRRIIRWWPLILVLAVVLAAYVRVLYGQSDAADAHDRADGGHTDGGAGGRAIPVTVASAKKGDMPVYLTGLGTVTPLRTVTVRSRVDGELMRVDFQEGQLVRAGSLLAELDPRPFEVQLAQAQGQKAKDEAALQNAKLDLERYETLVEQNSAPRQQLDTQRATVDQDAATIDSDQAQIDSARLNLTYARITADVTGRIGLRLVDPGNIVHATDQNGLAVLTQVSPISVIFTIPEDSLPQVLAKERSGVTLGVDAFDRDMKNTLARGTLLTTDNQIDQTTGTIRLRAQFQNADEALFPNQFVNARLLVDTLRGLVVIPTVAVQRSSQATFVYVAKPDGTADMRTVTVALTNGDQTGVSKGLMPGERIVTEGFDRLQQGSKIAARQ